MSGVSPDLPQDPRPLLAGRLRTRSRFGSGIRCKVCARKSAVFDTVDFNKYCSQEDFYSFGFSGVRVDYNRCLTCGAVFTNFFDEWSAQDFARHVYNDDYIKVDSEYASVRPRFVANDMARRWGECQGARVLDYGSGAGAFADELGRLGYAHVEAYDPFSSPARPTGLFDIVTCFEVIEHTPDPLETLKDICGYLKPDGCVVVSQTLQPDDIGRLRGNWWYVAPRNGHICTFTADSMALLAQACGLTFHLGTGPYGFSRAQRSAFASRALATMGEPHRFVVLSAPAGTGPVKGLMRVVWQKMEEGEDGPFRWTGASRLTWPLPALAHGAGTLRVMLPVFDRITPGMLEDVRGEVDGQVRPFCRSGANLVADFALRSTPSLITVRTREPVTPRALRGVDDDRRLGLAIFA